MKIYYSSNARLSCTVFISDYWFSLLHLTRKLDIAALNILPFVEIIALFQRRRDILTFAKLKLKVLLLHSKL